MPHVAVLYTGHVIEPGLAHHVTPIHVTLLKRHIMFRHLNSRQALLRHVICWHVNIFRRLYAIFYLFKNKTKIIKKNTTLSHLVQLFI